MITSEVYESMLNKYFDPTIWESENYILFKRIESKEELFAEKGEILIFYNQMQRKYIGSIDFADKNSTVRGIVGLTDDLINSKLFKLLNNGLYHLREDEVSFNDGKFFFLVPERVGHLAIRNDYADIFRIIKKEKKSFGYDKF